MAAPDYCGDALLRDVNLLHIPPELSFGAHYGSVHAMADYRAYLVDEDGHFSEAVPLICADDTEAIEKAQPLAVNKDVELWQLDRKVAVLPSA
jgi:hypothetical protein